LQFQEQTYVILHPNTQPATRTHTHTQRHN
jgi:hypothetical protein